MDVLLGNGIGVIKCFNISPHNSKSRIKRSDNILLTSSTSTDNISDSTYLLLILMVLSSNLQFIVVEH